MIEEWFQRGDCFFVLRSNGTAFTRYLSRNPLRQLADRTIINEQRKLRLPQHVDESRRNDPAARVNHPTRGHTVEVADRNDPFAANPYIRCVPWTSAAVENVPVLDDDV